MEMFFLFRKLFVIIAHDQPIAEHELRCPEARHLPSQQRCGSHQTRLTGVKGQIFVQSVNKLATIFILLTNCTLYNYYVQVASFILLLLGLSMCANCISNVHALITIKEKLEKIENI